jgi:hypothetical protein
MDSADSGVDTQTLVDRVDAAVEIGDSEQEVINGRCHGFEILSHGDERSTAEQQGATREVRCEGAILERARYRRGTTQFRPETRINFHSRRLHGRNVRTADHALRIVPAHQSAAGV